MDFEEVKHFLSDSGPYSRQDASTRLAVETCFTNMSEETFERLKRDVQDWYARTEPSHGISYVGFECIHVGRQIYVVRPDGFQFMKIY